MTEDTMTHRLSGMYQNWFLDYASYVILERAVPQILDGLKPVQRRILHAMKRIDDGRYNKVAPIVGDTMKFHPHGDASIGDALVGLGQKDLLVDCQGNWGNILTGDPAAAPRYIEARLSKFALDVVFNNKTTDWKMSYDGRNEEPVTLPVKFPLLLAQGVEGIAVGLSSKILPHNFNELCDAAIAYLHDEEFILYPDFPTGGSIDVSRYNDGQRGGLVRVRAKIEKIDNKTLAITELPYGKTTSAIAESITRAIEKGKFKAKNVTDHTAANANILVHLTPGVSSDKTIDALYAFTDCEVSISPNCCVIDERKPAFLTVSDVLRRSVDYTLSLLRKELEIRRAELLEQLHFASLEQIFIEERIYKDRGFEQAPDMEHVISHIDGRLEPFKKDFVREVTADDIKRLVEIKMARILKFNKAKAEEAMARMKGEVAEIEHKLSDMVAVTTDWFRMLKERYGARFPRRTEVRGFDNIVAAKVAEANQKLYVNRDEGFIGTGLKKDEFVCNCSDLDDVIVFYKDGTYKIVRIADKLFVGETERSKAEKKKAEIQHVQVFKKGDTRTIYNVIYRDGKSTTYYAKRFNVTGATRDREYDLTQGKPGSKIMYFSPNPNGEAEIVKVTLRPNPKLKRGLVMDYDFSQLTIKGKQSMGNIVTKFDVHRIQLRSEGVSTLGGREVWFDWDVHRLNYDGRGERLGEFHGSDLILVILDNGDFYTTSFDATNHYETSIMRIEKFDPTKVWCACYLNADQQMKPYIKRFRIEASAKHINMMGGGESALLLLTDTPYPRLSVTRGGGDEFRGAQEIEAFDFIGEKGVAANGKRLTDYTFASVEELEPTRVPEEPKPEETAETAAEQATEARTEEQAETATEQAEEPKTEEPTAESAPEKQAEPTAEPVDNQAKEPAAKEPAKEPAPENPAKKPATKELAKKHAPEKPAKKPAFPDNDDNVTQLSLFD